MTSYSKVEEQVGDYRLSVLEVLKHNKFWFDTDQVSLQVKDWNIDYHRWKHPYQGNWELTSLFTEEILSNLQKIITPGSTVLDIGAQTGNMSVAYSLFADRVYAFEPNPATYEVLEKNSKVNTNIVPLNFAVSDIEGPLEFHYSDSGLCNGGFATRTEVGIGVTGHKVPIDIWAVRVDSLVKSSYIDIKDLSLIKIDAEGHDKDIIPTLDFLFKEYKPVLITEIYDGLTPNEVDKLLSEIHKIGYRAFDEKDNNLDIDKLDKEIRTHRDIRQGSGHNLICIHDPK